MLLTITYEGENTQNLGFLLYKNPNRAQQFKLTYGKAYVFYPEVSDTRTTVALLLDIDPIDLARGKLGSKDGGLFDYVNDRPYASTSFLSTAIARVFGTAMSGKNDKFQELADTPLNLTARLSALRDNRNEALAEQLFAPLGYTVTTTRGQLDEQFPEWGISPYIELAIHGTVRLSELLNHLYVLIPVFDRQKHYYYSKDEVQKLLSHGEGWLATHPQKERIIYRYFAAKKGFANQAIDILLPEETAEEAASELPEDGTEISSDEAAEDGTMAATEHPSNENPKDNMMAAATENADEAADTTEAPHRPLNTVRLTTVRDAIVKSGATSVIDLGCGEGRLTALLLAEPQIKRITACDVSVRSLEKAASRLSLNRMPAFQREKLTLMQASLTYKDDRFAGYDCACVIEVIEHIDPSRLPAMERSVFEFAAPQTVIVTTPNREYNVNYDIAEGGLRHGDHRFEWTREEFLAWTKHICEKFHYTCEINGIGDNDEAAGMPTQMGVFTKNGKN